MPFPEAEMLALSFGNGLNGKAILASLLFVDTIVVVGEDVVGTDDILICLEDDGGVIDLCIFKDEDLFVGAGVGVYWWFG